MCQLSSCTTDRSCLAWFWPGLSLHYSVPGHHPGPSACSHHPITRCPLPSGGSTWSPSGFHPAHRAGLCQQLKMCNDVHHQLPDVITEFTKTNSTHRTVNKLLAIFSSYWTVISRINCFVYSDRQSWKSKKMFFSDCQNNAKCFSTWSVYILNNSQALTSVHHSESVSCSHCQKVCWTTIPVRKHLVTSLLILFLCQTPS